MGMSRLFVFCLFSVFGIETMESLDAQGNLTIRDWNEVVLEAIRLDLARPNVHARNLYHWSLGVSAMTEVYHQGSVANWPGPPLSADQISMLADAESAEVLHQAISGYTHAFVTTRYVESPGFLETQAYLATVFETTWNLAFDEAIDELPAVALGVAHAHVINSHFINDGANQIANYANPCYVPLNDPLDVTEEGSCDFSLDEPDHWQPLAFGGSFVDQAGNETFQDVVPFSGANWGGVVPFALDQYETPIIYERGGCEFPVYLDPGPLGTFDLANDSGLYDYQTGFATVVRWQNHLDPTDGVMWDISPRSLGNMNAYPSNPAYLYNVEDGGDFGTGHALNPMTGEPYAPQWVLRGDFTRVLAEFWADGPDSETPPGHWFGILNEVSNHSDFTFMWKGTEPLDPQWWMARTYMALGGAMHDASIAAWGAKGAFDFVRPISAVRHMLSLGQSSDPNLPQYQPDGIPLMEGVVEIIEAGDPLAVNNPNLLGAIKTRMWLGEDPGNGSLSNFGWSSGCSWWPYQRPTFVTPPFAGYVSGHSTYSRAAAEILTLATGSSYFPGGLGSFEIPADTFLAFESGPSVAFTLQWATYKDAADQCALSRIWGGIHPPMDDIRGRMMGITVAEHAWNQIMNQLESSPATDPGTFCPEDVDENGTVNTNDLLLLLSRFGDDC